MIKLKLSSDKHYLEVIHYDFKKELSEFKLHFRKRAPGYFFDVRYKRKIWDGYDNFYEDGKISVGFWAEVVRFQEKTKIEVEIIGLEDIFDNEIKEEDINKFSDVFFKNSKINPADRPYQIQAAYKMLKYKYCIGELATSAGKTLIAFIIFAYLHHKREITKDKKLLIIVPNKSLIGQIADEWNEYNNEILPLNIIKIGGGNKKPKEEELENSNIIIGTYQSLINLEDSFYDKINNVIIDETHKAKGNSIKEVLSKIKSPNIRLGLSGTVDLKNDDSTYYKIQKVVGPIVYMVKTDYLIQQKVSPNVHVHQMFLEYDQNDPIIKNYINIKENGSGMFSDPNKAGQYFYTLEKDLIIQNDKRFKWVCNFLKKTSKNTLVLFSNVKDGYGKQICDEMSKHKISRYVDGSISKDDRATYIKEMEESDNMLIVASLPCFSTGINIKRLFNIVFVENNKSEINTRQSIGRGLRNYNGKSILNIIDIVDNFSDSCYSIKHSQDRLKIYKEQNFKVFTYKIKLYE